MTAMAVRGVGRRALVGEGCTGQGWSGRGRRQRGRARAQNRRGGDKRSKRDVRTDVHTQAGGCLTDIFIAGGTGLRVFSQHNQ